MRQADVQKVQKCIIDPMLTYYGGKLNDAQFTAFVDDLGEYDEKTLSDSWVEVRRTRPNRPNVSHFLDAIRTAKNHSNTYGSPSADAVMPWTQKDIAAAVAFSEFKAQFRLSTLMIQAIAEGWDKPLERYACAAARMQADIIAGVKNTGYSNAAYDWGDATPAKVKQRRIDFEQKNRAQAASGIISISVPSEAIQAWKNYSL